MENEIEDHRPQQPSGFSYAMVLGLVGCVSLYVGLFVAVLVDELYLGSNYFVTYLPNEFDEYFRLIYWPVLKLFGFI